MSANSQSKLPARTEIFINPRVRLVNISTVRTVRGCDAEAVLNCVGDATHPHFLRWVFNLALKQDGKIRELRFLKDELLGPVDKWAAPRKIIEKILGDRRSFPRGEIEVQWTINATTISRLIARGELTEIKNQITRASLAAFLERRLQ